MSSNSESIGSLVIDLRANVAQLRVDMEEVKNTIAKSSREMSSQMKHDMNETRQVLALMKDDFGVGVPRELRKVIASSELARTAILGIKDALFGLAFINLGIEAFEKIKGFFEGMQKANEEATKEVLKQIKAEIDLRISVEMNNKAHEERLRLMGLIGKSEEEKFQSEKQHLETVIHLQSQELLQLQEKAGFQELAARQEAMRGVNQGFFAGDAEGQEQKKRALQLAQDEIDKVTGPVRKQIEELRKKLIESEDAYQSLKLNHGEAIRQDNRKTAEQEQKQLEQAIAKVGEFVKASEKTLDPLEQNRLKWEEIRKEQGALIEQNPKIIEHVTLVGTVMAQWRADQKIITEEAAKLPGELAKGIAELQKIEKAKDFSSLFGAGASSAAQGKPQLDASLAAFKQNLIDNFNSPLKDSAEQSKLLHQAMEDLLTPTDKFEVLQAEIAPLMEKYSKYPDAIRALQNELLKANPEFQKLQAASAEFGRDLSNELDQLILHGKSFGDVLKSLAADIEEIALKALLLKPLEDFFSGGKSGTGGIFGFLGSLFGGGSSAPGGFIPPAGFGGFLPFADGGSPPVGQVSLVGEQGPELFVPHSAGTIVPNKSLGGVTNVFQIDARGAAPGSEAAIMRGIQRALDHNVTRSVAAARDSQRRR